MEVGGLYHTTQVDLRECSDIDPEDLLSREDVEGLFLILFSVESFVTKSFSLFSAAGDGDTRELPKSSDVAGVFGVLADDPKDANAPDPSPKAEEAPEVGEAMVVVDEGAIELSGLDLPLDELSPPKRLAAM